MARPPRSFVENPVAQAIPEALLLDGTAIYQASKAHYSEWSLNYQSLADTYYKRAGFKGPGSAAPDSVHVMWTSAMEGNEGQSKFLKFVETTINWQVRRFKPADSYMVDLGSSVALGGSPHAAQRLMRFDAPIAFAMGRLAETHRIMLVTDSFALADPLLRAIEIGGREAYLAFFGRALDSRWLRVIRSTPKLNFIDLDDSWEELFGVPRRPSSESLPKDKSRIF